MIKVLIADDYAVVRQGLRMLISINPDLVVVGEAENGKDAVESTRRLSPDVVVMDLQMPQVNGIEAARSIRRESPQTTVLLLTLHDTEDVRSAAADAGIAHLIPKHITTALLMSTIRQAHAGAA